jgi:predicted aspartyl protease
MMADEMGTFRVSIEIENPGRPGTRIEVRDVLVATGAELSSVPKALLQSLGVERRKGGRFRQADGTVLERVTGYAIIRAGGTETVDEVVFGEPGDLVLLGARTLEGLNLRIDPVTKQFVDAGPAPAAVVG